MGLNGARDKLPDSREGQCCSVSPETNGRDPLSPAATVPLKRGGQTRNHDRRERGQLHWADRRRSHPDASEFRGGRDLWVASPVVSERRRLAAQQNQAQPHQRFWGASGGARG